MESQLIIFELENGDTIQTRFDGLKSIIIPTNCVKIHIESSDPSNCGTIII